MAQIRATIELLTKIFRENGTSKIKAETFRLAKFNEDEAVLPLFRLLFELLYYLEYKKIDGVTVKAFSEMTQEEAAVYVKREIAKIGFHSRDFASVPNDLSEGSREALLAIGWLLCKQNIVTEFMNNVTSPLDEDTAHLYQEEGADTFLCIQHLPPSATNASLRVQQLLWINNKLNLSLRNLYALQREKNILQHKTKNDYSPVRGDDGGQDCDLPASTTIPEHTTLKTAGTQRLHEATYGTSITPERNHLSVFEAYMLRHPDVLKKNIQLLEKDNERLNNLLKWRDTEDVFWKWMESVLDEKVKRRQPKSDLSFPVPDESVSGLHHSYTDLRQAIVKYEAIVEHLDRLWIEKSSELSEEDLDRVIKSIDLELSVQKANIALNNCESYIKEQNNQPRFILEKAKCAKKNQLPFSPASDLPTIEICDIEDEIKQIHSLVDHLQEEVSTKQDQFKMEMQSLSSKFTNAICIPPMVRKSYNV